MLDIDLLVDILKCLKSLVTVFFRKLRTIVISSTHEMCLWLLLLSYFVYLMSLCSIRINYLARFFKNIVNNSLIRATIKCLRTPF